MVLKGFKENPRQLRIRYQRATPPRIIPLEIEQNIPKELTMEKKIIQNKEIPLKSYNYNYQLYQGSLKREVSSEGLPVHDH